MPTIYPHPETPQPRLIAQIRAALPELVILPTPFGYAACAPIDNNKALEKLTQLHQKISIKKAALPLFLAAPSLSNLAHFADINDDAHRFLSRFKKATNDNAGNHASGAVELPAKKALPKALQSTTKTVIAFIPAWLDTPILQAIFHKNGEETPLAMVILPELPSYEYAEQFEHLVVDVGDVARQTVGDFLAF